MKEKFNILSLVIIILITTTTVSQKNKTCDTKKEDFELNSIVAKCAVKVENNNSKDKKINKVNVTISASKIKRSRVKRKRITSIDNLEGSDKVVLDISKTRIQTPEIIKNLSRKISAEEIAKSVPLTAIKNVPVFPACLSKPQHQHLQCFNEELSKHVQKNLRYPVEAALNKIEGDVWVRFIINSKGEVSNIDVRGPKNGQLLEEEVKQVIALLPKFKPGVYNGKTINTKYALPINFVVDKDEE